jgi:hypothetical protein
MLVSLELRSNAVSDVALERFRPPSCLTGPLFDLDGVPICRHKRIDLTNVMKLARLHQLLPYSYRRVTVAFAYDDG